MAETVRLSAVMRDAIVDSAIAATFDERGDKLARAEDKLGRKFYNSVITPKQRKLVDQLPEDWFAWRHHITFNVGGRQQTFNLVTKAGTDSKKEAGYLPVPSIHNTWNPIGAISNSEDVETAWIHFDTRDALTKEKHKVRSTLSAMLKSVRTLKELRNIWPEGEAFYAGLEPSKRTLPMPLIRDINAMLGLPR